MIPRLLVTFLAFLSSACAAVPEVSSLGTLDSAYRIPECGTTLTLRVVEVYPDGAKIAMDAPPTFPRVTGWFWSIAPWQITAKLTGYPPGTNPPRGWILSGLGPLPNAAPWHFKTSRIGTGADGAGFVIDCAEVDFVIPFEANR